MCVLLVLRRPGELWIAANRDERLDRPWGPPRRLVGDPLVWGGQDLVAGGSWLALNLDAGFLVGVTNARLGARPRERSRGQLVLEAASERSLPEAVAWLGEVDLEQYGPFNLLLAGLEEVWTATNTPEPTVGRVDSQVIALGNEALAGGARTSEAALRVAALATGPEGLLREGLVRMLANHDGGDPLCRHGNGFGTVCSTLVCLRRGGDVLYEFAPGPPCTTPFAPVPIPRSPVN